MSALDSVANFVAFVDAAPLGVIATVGPDGEPQAALVSFAATTNGDLVLDARSDSRKIANIRRDRRVAVVLGGTGDVSVQVEADATIESGAAREVAAEIYEQRFPGSSVHAEGFAVVRLRPRWLRRYDAGAEPARVDEGVPAWVT